ncbi:hypothetical protein ACOMHN_009976 [Nucella lapillus]
MTFPYAHTAHKISYQCHQSPLIREHRFKHKVTGGCICCGSFHLFRASSLCYCVLRKLRPCYCCNSSNWGQLEQRATGRGRHLKRAEEGTQEPFQSFKCFAQVNIVKTADGTVRGALEHRERSYN